MRSAYLLVSHGSRDPRPQVAMRQLATLVSQRCTPWEGAAKLWSPHAATAAKGQVMVEHQAALVGTAYLELSPMPLHEQIKEFGDRTRKLRCDKIQVVPLFLLPGVHVMEDIPAEVAIACAAAGQELQMRPHLGTHPGLTALLANQIAATEVDVWIVLAHGSRRAGSKQAVEAIAKCLGAASAYWAVPPKLEARVQELMTAGYTRIGILPYFLFAGGITDAIARSVEELQVQFPNVMLHLAEPLGVSYELADLIGDLLEA